MMEEIKILHARYETLIKAEQELKLLKMAVATSDGYSSDLKRIRTMFNIREEGTENETI